MVLRVALLLRCVLTLAVVFVGANVASADVPLAPALRTDDLDAAACSSFVAGQAAPVDLPTLVSVLGLHESAVDKSWQGRQANRDPSLPAVHYRVAFVRPITIGSLLTFGDPRDVALLKADAPYPGDPEKPEHWQSLSYAERQTGGRTTTLDQPLATRAVLVTDRTAQGRSRLEALRIWTERRFNAVPSALAYAATEYYRPPANFSSPFTYHASLVTTGGGPWQSSGKGTEGRITTPPISDIAPSWFMLTWDSAQKFDGLWIDGSLLQYELDTFDGPTGVNPRTGTDAEWRKLTTVKRFDKHGTWLQFEPVATRGFRLRITKSSEPQVAEIRGMHALVALGDAPIPTELAAPKSGTADTAVAPKQISVAMPFEGQLTVVVDGPDGRRVKNVLDRESLASGAQPVGWNLQDESGRYVAPGKYRWKAVAHPPLELKYEQTAYPNTAPFAPDNAPWLTTAQGPDGWLADHTPPISGCALGDRMYVGAMTAESGVSLLECDLDGRKTWGHHSFAAWTGPRFLAGDGRTLFAAARMLNDTTDVVWSVDTETRAIKQILNLAPTALRKRGMQGIAVRDGKLAMSVHGDPSWLATAASGDDVDLPNCIPTYAPQRKVTKGIAADKRGDFLRLLRLIGTPPGTCADGSLVTLQAEPSSDDQQHLLVGFKRAIPLGSLVLASPALKGTAVKFSVLKTDAPYPPDVHDGRQWSPLPTPTTAHWDVIAAPPGTQTRALRITFARGSAAADGDDPLGKLLEQNSAKRDVPADPLAIDRAKKPTSARGAGSLGNTGDQWQGRLEGLKLLRRRFESRLPQAAVRFNSGRMYGQVWDAERSEPLTGANPGIYALEWKEPQALHGLAIREIDGRLTKVDVYEGDAASPIDIGAESGWREIAQYEQPRRDYYNPSSVQNTNARYLDGYVDFGGEVRTRAVRLRVVEQWSDNGERGTMGVRDDQGGKKIEPSRCRVYGVLPLSYIGGEAPLEDGLSERIDIFAAADGKPLLEVPLAHPGSIAYHPQGELYAVSGTQVVRVDMQGSSHQPFVTDLEKPSDLAFDAEGNLYVFDRGAERKQIRVYDSTGKFLRAIGTAGGFRAGAWDPTRLGEVSALEVDARGQVWAVESQYWPKRVTVWTREGRFVREHLGNTEYGGGGVLDSQDKTRLVCGPLEFALDWDKGTSRLKNLTWTGSTPAGEVPIRVGERLYLVTRPIFNSMKCGIVYLYEDGRLKLAAAAGQAAAFEPLKSEAVMAKIAGQPLTERHFHWSDLNGDGEVQAEEVVLTADPKPAVVTNFDHDLGLQAGTLRYVVKEYLPSGVPVYAEERFPALTGDSLYRLADGNFFRLGTGALPEALLAADGSTLWSHESEGNGVHSLYSATPWRPSQVVAEFGVVGRLKHPIGEMIVLHGNAGGWNVWTADGLLIGPIFHDQRDGKAQPWSMREHARGQTLADVTPGQEHFHGYACVSEDGKTRIVAGHNHVTVLEVAGLERATRLEGEIEVTADDLRNTQVWARAKEKQEVYARSPVIDCYRAKVAPKIDGDLGEWTEPFAAEVKEGRDRYAQFRMSFDERNLYLAYDVRGYGPLRNAGGEFARLFKTGASVDLQLGVDPASAADRSEPAVGDSRLLLTFADQEPTAVLYRPTVPGTPEDKVYRVVSPVGEVAIDRVDRLPEVQLARSGTDEHYTLEAAVPLAALGLKPAAGLRLKLDWGLLVSGPNGSEVIRRVYWSNQATNIVADAPSEARLHPNLWGHVLFHDQRRTAEDRLDSIDKPTAPKGLEDLLDGKRK
ncbi:MAG: hypothetical protein K8U03_06470 [Planctomycetia bacterium]|nr:hypothetical protein [Planctomycetia bacterium]